nr:hypothetical protein [Tanacetum cinerariifolium]
MLILRKHAKWDAPTPAPVDLTEDEEIVEVNTDELFDPDARPRPYGKQRPGKKKFDTSEALGGNTRDLDSIWEETGKDYNFTRSGFKDARTVSRDGVAIPSDVIRTYKRQRQELWLVSSFMASQDARLSTCESDLKQQQVEMTNKIDTFLKAINDRMTRAHPSDTVKNLKLNVNSTSLVLSACSYPMEDSQCSSHSLNSINGIKTCSKQTSSLQKDQLQTVIEIGTSKPKNPKKALEDEFKDLHLNLPVLEVLAHAPMYNAILDKYVESLDLGDSKPFDTLADLGSCVNLIPLHLFKKLKIGLLEETDHIFELADGTKSYPVGIVKNVEVHIGRLRLLDDFYVIDVDKDPATSLLIGKGFLATVNPVIDYRKAKLAVTEGVTRSIFGVKEIDLGEEDVPYWTTLGKQESYTPRPSTYGIGGRAWHAKIRLIDPVGEEFAKTFQSIPTTRKLSEKENPSKIIDLDHFHDS